MLKPEGQLSSDVTRSFSPLPYHLHSPLLLLLIASIARKRIQLCDETGTDRGGGVRRGHANGSPAVVSISILLGSLQTLCPPPGVYTHLIARFSTSEPMAGGAAMAWALTRTALRETGRATTAGLTGMNALDTPFCVFMAVFMLKCRWKRGYERDSSVCRMIGSWL